MIVLVAHYKTKEGMADAVEAALAEMVAAVKAGEPGCPLFHVCRSQERPDEFLLYEHYVDQAALAAHSQTPHFAEIILGRVVPMLEKRERVFYELRAS